MTQLELAYEEYVKRQNRETHPGGKFDRGGRWYPSEEEEQDCCRRIRNPSRSFPYSLLTHCRSMNHVARLFGVKASELRKMYKERNPANREGGEEYYKLVAVVGGRYFSIFDGETEYVLGETLTETARQKHNGGYYVYTTPGAAQCAPFPEHSAMNANSMETVILRLRAGGTYCRYDNGKLAFSRVTPLEVVEVGTT